MTICEQLFRKRIPSLALAEAPKASFCSKRRVYLIYGLEFLDGHCHLQVEVASLQWSGALLLLDQLELIWVETGNEGNCRHFFLRR